METVDPASSPGEPTLPVVRFAVFEGAESDSPFATITISKNTDSGWSVQLAADTDAAAARINPILDEFGANRRSALVQSPEPATPPDDFGPLADLLRLHGFRVEELPAGDFQVNIQLDLNTGSMIGTQDAMHAFASPDSPLGRHIVDAIAQSFAKGIDDLAIEVDALLDKNETNEAVEAIKRGADKGAFSLPPTRKLLSSLVRLNVSGLPDADKRMIRDARLTVAQRLGQHEIAGKDADALLIENPATLTTEQIASLRTIVAIAAIKRGNRETGLSILYDLVKDPSELSPESRAWAWRNISMVLDPKDPELRRANQLSADAFLEAGNKHEAGKSLMGLVNILMNHDPAEAIKTLNEIVKLLDQDGLLDRRVRAAALHARANRLARLNKHEDAFKDAAEAVALSRNLIGIEAEFVSSLHLAAIEALHVGDTAAAEAYEAEAENLTEELKLSHFQLAQRTSTLAQEFDANLAEELLTDAEAANNLEIIAAVRILQATADVSLGDTARLEILEETRNRIVAAKGRDVMLQPVRMAMAQQLVRMKQHRRAETWFREILDIDAFNGFARNGLINCLWETEQWGDAAIFLRKQLTLRGDLPGLMFALGKSLFEAGDLSGAVTTLTKLIALQSDDEHLLKSGTELRERALQLGGTVLPAALAPTAGPLTRAEFERALDDFARFIAAEKRMTFWVPDKKGGHKWVSSPEARAQDFLHTFLKARFDSRAELFEEIGTGAGRLDLYVKLSGGLSIIIELKMCGAPYSSTYAATGEGQIRHYMDNRNTNLGYLVVFDGRIDTFSNGLLSTTGGTGHTIIEKFIDVRSRVKKS